MKWFSWMHRKSQKDSRSSFNGSLTETHFPNDQQYENRYHFNSFSVENNEEFNRSGNEDIFPGFLTIGTLSLEPATPTLDSPLEKTNEDQIPEFKYDLKLISEELEKFLEAEVGKDERISQRMDDQTTTVVLDDKVKEEGKENDPVKIHIYPLQEYLLGSSTGHVNSKEKAKKEERSSHKLAKITKKVNRSPYKEDEVSQKQATKKIKKSSHVKNKMQRTPPTCPNFSPASIGCAATPFPTFAKLKKLFPKKIYPEFGKEVKEPHKISKPKKQNIHNQLSGMLGRKSNGTTPLMNENFIHSRTGMERPHNHLNLPQKEMTGGLSREHWIKTDADYFVLELQ